MILIPHILVGAAIASKIPNIWGLILAFLSHFVLDAIPHFEYKIKGIQRLKKNRFLRDVLKVELDFCLGVMIFTFVAVDLSPIRVIYGLLGVAAAVLPDGLMFFYYISGKRWFKNLGEFHYFIHTKGQKSKTKRKPSFLKILTQVLAAIVAIIILVL